MYSTLQHQFNEWMNELTNAFWLNANLTRLQSAPIAPPLINWIEGITLWFLLHLATSCMNFIKNIMTQKHKVICMFRSEDRNRTSKKMRETSRRWSETEKESIHTCRTHLPSLDRSGHTDRSCIVEQIELRVSVDCLCWINPRSDAGSTPLCKGFHYRMIHLSHLANFDVSLCSLGDCSMLFGKKRQKESFD